MENKTPMGMHSLWQVLEFYHIEKNEDKFLADNKSYLNEDKLSIEQLQKLAKRYSLRTHIINNIAADDLNGMRFPIIAKLIQDHYCVIVAVQQGLVIFFNEATGQAAAMPQDKFTEIFSGSILTFDVKFNVKYMMQKYNLPWFFNVIKHYRKYFYEIMAAVFFLQIMAIGMPLITQVIVDKVIGNSGFSTLTVIGCAMVVFFFMQMILNGTKTHLLNNLTNKLDAILGKYLFDHLVSLPLPYFEQHPTGDTLMRVQSLNSIRSFLTDKGLNTVLNLLFTVVFIVFMLYYSPPLTMVVLIIIPLYIIQNYFLVDAIQYKTDAMWRAGTANQSFLVEAIGNMTTIKSLAVEPQFNHRWEKLQAKYMKSTFENAKLQILINGFSGIVQGVTSLGVLWYGGHLVMNGTFTLGQFIAFQMVSNQAMRPMTELLTMWPDVQRTSLALERIGDILNTPAEPVLREQNNLCPLRGEIRIDNVTFGYRPDLPPALRNINLMIRAGECIGIVGHSGSGKSTLTKILQRMYMPNAGAVFIDGTDLNHMGFAALRQQLGVISQEAFLFDRSVRDNIAIGRNTASMEEVMQAAKLAGAHDFILQLKDGYDTMVGERGAKLSGGQRQRIIIARAMLLNPSIYILDEATSALDYDMEKLVMNNLRNAARGKTMLIIAHRMSTVHHCDRIVVMEHGKIVDIGTHNELIQRDGIYKNLYEAQKEAMR